MVNSLRSLAIVFVGLALATAPAAAQGFGLGFEGGVNISDLSGEGVEADAEVGFRGGGILQYDLPGGVFGLRTGGIFSRKGAGSSDGALSGDLDLDYIEVPVNLVLNIPIPGSPIHPRLRGGTTLNFELDCQITGSGGGTEVPVSCDEAALETESLDFGFKFGGGFGIDLGPAAALNLDVDYDLGLTDIVTADTSELKNRSLALSGGFVFHL